MVSLINICIFSFPIQEDINLGKAIIVILITLLWYIYINALSCLYNMWYFSASDTDMWQWWSRMMSEFFYHFKDEEYEKTVTEVNDNYDKVEKLDTCMSVMFDFLGKLCKHGDPKFLGSCFFCSFWHFSHNWILIYQNHKNIYNINFMIRDWNTW